MTAMVMLSHLLQFKVVDDSSASMRLVDLALGALDVDYPQVSRLLLRPAGQGGSGPTALPWEAVKQVDTRRHIIRVAGLEATEPLSDDQARGLVLLHRDVLDALVIDLANQRVTRANDLALALETGQLRLRSADIGLRAILRRITRSRYRGTAETDLVDWKFIEFLRGDPAAVSRGAGYHRRIVHMPPGEIAHLSLWLPYLHAAELAMLLPDQTAADVLEALPAERQLIVFEELDEAQAQCVLEKMAPDLAADLVGRLATGMARHYLERLPRASSQAIIDLLRYPEDTVGGIMTNDVVTVPAGLTVRQARRVLRERLRQPDFIYFVYVVENDVNRKLQGVVSLRSLLVGDETALIESLMNRYLVTLSPLASPQEAAYRLLSSQLAALPVVGAEGELLGALTVDVAVAQVAPANWRAQAPRIFS